MEPTIISQNADGLTGDAARAWFNKGFQLAKRAGARHARCSVHPEKGWLLFEAWPEAPKVNGELCEGEPRWQIAAQSFTGSA